MPAEPISEANLDITERFFKSVKVNDEDEDDAQEDATASCDQAKEGDVKDAVEK